MDQMIAVFANSFSSDRLVFLPLGACEKTQEFMHDMFADPVRNGLGNPAVLLPINRKDSDERLDHIIKHSLLAVAICLRPTASGKTEPSNTGSAEQIGYLSLNKAYSDGIMGLRTVSMSVSFSPAHQGLGLGREAINWALDWAFGYANLHCVQISTAEFNDRALRLYRSLGFVDEGRKRKHSFFNHKWYDHIELSMLEEEYYCLRKGETA